MDGILNIAKPQGITSFGVVAMVRRLTGERRVGHAGTLDPEASGVLAVGIGRGTRVIEFLMDARKTYRARIRLGRATDTYDAAGRTLEERDASSVSETDFRGALDQFRGEISQTPPMYSALKRRGRPLYELARAGIEVERAARRVTIYRLELIAWEPALATIEVECSKGTYIRSLAHDLGQALGCGAHLESLVRLAVGPFTIDEAISLGRLEEACREGNWQNLAHPIDSALSHLPAVVVGEEQGRFIENGRPVAIDYEAGTGKPVNLRAYSLDGRFLGVLRFNAEIGLWHPRKVLR